MRCRKGSGDQPRVGEMTEGHNKWRRMVERAEQIKRCVPRPGGDQGNRKKKLAFDGDIERRILQTVLGSLM